MGEHLDQLKRIKLPRSAIFSQRVPNPWNKLSRKAINSTKLSSFKAQFDKMEVIRREIRRENADRPYKLLYHMV